ncbi:MAG: group 1 truncated hemoglobin [Methylococcales bacterium]|jgi:hemoglobin|nr:group 1 truncated hemoglobin [Methylococcales bacterium]MBT7445833.1 group 1 truncated hemoglobin [Methylococcales bacterium]
MLTKHYLIPLLCLTLCYACASPSTKTEANLAPLYNRIGGSIAISTITDVLVDKMERDKRINPLLVDSNITQLKQQITTYLCAISDGNCRYTGQPIKDVLTTLAITTEQFEIIRKHFVNTMIQFHVPLRVQKDMIKRLHPLKKHSIGQ